MNNTNTKDYEYVISGDTQEFKDCLVLICGTYENAEKCLQRMVNNPTENDKKLSEGHKNLRIEKVSKENCWWNGNCD